MLVKHFSVLFHVSSGGVYGPRAVGPGLESAKLACFALVSRVTSSNAVAEDTDV